MSEFRRKFSLEFFNRIIIILVGIFLISTGIYLFMNSQLGLTPFTVLIDGLTAATGLTFGQTTIMFNLTVIAIFLIFTDKKFGPGTVLNAVFVGLFLDGLMLVFGSLSPEFFLTRISLLFAAIISLGSGIAIYVSVGMGEGPIEAVMMFLQEKTDLSLKSIRVSMDLSFGTLGYLLGSSLGIGTVIAAMAIGPVTQGVFGFITRAKAT
ncbi:MAG: YczE/YyaS/YitT family protein [Bacillota bacterium]